MKVIHVLRKPLSEGSVAQNVLHHGTGALNIDATRISTGGPSPSVKRRQNKAPGLSVGATGWITPPRPPSYNEQRAGELLGRWPANLILQHLDGCGSPPSEGCAPVCPVPALDAQSGTTKSSGGRAYQNTNDMYDGGWGHKGSGVAMDPGYGDVGGVSRYYKQVGGHDDDPAG